MRFKADWYEYLHNTRQREIEIAFAGISDKQFELGLEVGAGDGYQTTLLRQYFEKFISSDWNFERIKAKNRLSSVEYIKCDAENLGNYFSRQKFDVIFSSNMLEHLKQPDKYIKDAYMLLKDDGLFINSVPNRIWKLSQFFLHHLNMAILVLNRLTDRSRQRNSKNKTAKKINLENNLKSSRNYSKLRKLLWPVPHGEYKNNWEEFLKFGRKRWIREFERANFKIVSVKKGPVVSGYGFGWNGMRNFLERSGIGSIDIFICKKNNK